MPYPLIKWGPSNFYVLAFTEHLDERLSWTEDRDGSETAQAAGSSGKEYAWSLGTDCVFTGAFRFIGQNDELSGGDAGGGVFNPCCGWDGPYGVKAWLGYARLKMPFLFYPDVDGPGYLCYLVDPMTGPAEDEDNGYRVLRVRFRTVAGDIINTF